MTAEVDINWQQILSAYHKRDNYSHVFTGTVSKLRTQVDLASVHSCLAIGPGEGRYEVEFLKTCVPNLRELSAVEPEHRSAEVLRANLAESLPRLELKIVGSAVQCWPGPVAPVDLVLIFHTLYFLTESDRRDLYRQLRDGWLNPGRFLVIVSDSHTQDPRSHSQIYARLGSPTLAWEQVEAELLQSRFVREHAYEMRLTRDLSDPDDAFLRFYQKRVEKDASVTLDEVDKVIRELFPAGKSDLAVTTLGLFRAVQSSTHC